MINDISIMNVIDDLGCSTSRDVENIDRLEN